MKIAVLTSGILPVPSVQGGAVENLVEFYLEYNEAHPEHEITVYSIANEKTKESPLMNYIHTHFYFINTKSIWYKIKKKLFSYYTKTFIYNNEIDYFLHSCLDDIKRQYYDYIIMENRPGYVLTVSEYTDAKLIVHQHNDYLNAYMSHGKDILDKCHRVLTVSDYINSRVSTIYKSDKIRTVHNGINVDNFTQYIPDCITRKQLGFSENDFILVYSGRIIPEKGVDKLIDAMIMLKDYSKIKLMIIGNSFFGNEGNDNPYITELKKKANIIKENILFTGFIPYNKMPEYLRISDVAVIPSIWDDPFPTTVLEAQAIGLPIISTYKGGIPEEVNTTNNAILLHVDDCFIEKMCNAIKFMYDNPYIRKNMSEESRYRGQLYKKEIYSKNFFNNIIH